MISQTVEYALRAACYLAQQSPNARTTSQIAEATHVPAAYLSKVLQSLNRAGILQSQRGVGGGISLAIEPSKLSILTVVNAVDPLQRIHTCPLGLESHGVQLCPLHKRLDNALATFEAAFRDTTLAEVLAERSASTPLCEMGGLQNE
jgi:Rrf2 family protein